MKNYLDQCDWARDVDSRQSWHYVAFVTEQDDVGDGVVEHWTILDGAGPWVTMVQLLPRPDTPQGHCQLNWTEGMRWIW